MTHKYNWMDPNDTEVETCSICKEEIYGWGHNPQPVIVPIPTLPSSLITCLTWLSVIVCMPGKKLEVSDSCCSDCNDNLVLPTRQTSTNDRKDLN